MSFNVLFVVLNFPNIDEVTHHTECDEYRGEYRDMFNSISESVVDNDLVTILPFPLPLPPVDHVHPVHPIEPPIAICPPPYSNE